MFYLVYEYITQRFIKICMFHTNKESSKNMLAALVVMKLVGCSPFFERVMGFFPFFRCHEQPFNQRRPNLLLQLSSILETICCSNVSIYNSIYDEKKRNKLMVC